MMTVSPKVVFLILCFLFFIYTLSIYLTPALAENNNSFDRALAAEGRLVFQQYNCQSCHQLYGLGGYLGPDLTNIYADPVKGEQVIRSVVMYGSRQMPAFQLNEEEMLALVEFLRSTDASGIADPRNFIVLPDGMIKPK